MLEFVLTYIKLKIIMKKFLKVFAIVAIMLSVISVAEAKSKSASKAKVETKESKFVTKEFFTNIDCESCAKKIMNVLPFQKGVKSVDVKVPKRTVTVTYDPSKCTEAAIVATLKKIDVLIVKKEEPRR